MKVNSKREILELISMNKQKILGYGIQRIGLFGSFVRNENTDKSDIDFVIKFDIGKKNYDNFIHLSFFLSDLLERKIELMTEESLSPYLRENIMSGVEYVPF